MGRGRVRGGVDRGGEREEEGGCGEGWRFERCHAAAERGKSVDFRPDADPANPAQSPYSQYGAAAASGFVPHSSGTISPTLAMSRVQCVTQCAREGTGIEGLHSVAVVTVANCLTRLVGFSQRPCLHGPSPLRKEDPAGRAVRSGVQGMHNCTNNGCNSTVRL